MAYEAMLAVEMRSQARGVNYHVLRAVAYYINKRTGSTFVGARKIGEHCRFSERAVRRSLDELEASGELNVIRQHGKTHIMSLPWFAGVADADDEDPGRSVRTTPDAPSALPRTLRPHLDDEYPGRSVRTTPDAPSAHPGRSVRTTPDAPSDEPSYITFGTNLRIEPSSERTPHQRMVAWRASDDARTYFAAAHVTPGRRYEDDMRLYTQWAAGLPPTPQAPRPPAPRPRAARAAL